ncbi:MAG: hypothetical protein V4611_03020 [Patescibacteria group bacterium]
MTKTIKAERPALLRAGAALSDLKLLTGSAERKFAESYLEKLNEAYLASDSTDGFESWALRLPKFAINHFGFVQSESELWVMLFGRDGRGGPYRFAGVLDGVMRRSGLSLKTVLKSKFFTPHVSFIAHER